MAGPKYPKQQLRAVSLETYFPGRLSAYAVLGQIQDAVEDQLGKLFVPNVEAGEALALRPFQLRDVDQKRSLAIALNQASYISFDYPGRETFLPQALELVGRALALLAPPSLSRVTFRYENELGVSRLPDGSVPAIEKLFPGVLPAAPLPPCTSIDSKLEGRWERQSITGTVGHHARVEQDSGLDVLRVTVFATVEAPSLAEMRSAAEAAHSIAFAHFEGIISDEYREFISGLNGGKP